MKIPSLIEIPTEIRSIQEWFATVISQPLTESDAIQPISYSGNPVEEEAQKFISGSCKLKPHKRLEIYNQQFWFRLFNFLEANFPLTSRLLGRDKFKKVATEFLVDNPPDHWSLTFLGKNFPKWIKPKNYPKLIEHSIEIDALCYASSLSSKQPAISLETFKNQDPNILLDTTLFLQPHLFLVHYPYDLFMFREEVLKRDLEYSRNTSTASLQESDVHYFVVFRTRNNNLAWQNIRETEFQLLQMLQKGCTILTLCDWIEHQDTSLQTEMAKNVQKFVQRWILNEWLTING